MAAGEGVDDEERRRHELMRAGCLGEGNRRASTNLVKPTINMESCLCYAELMKCRISKGTKTSDGDGGRKNAILLNGTLIAFKAELNYE